MSFKYPKNVIAGVGIIAAFLAATVLLGGYVNSKAAEEPVVACQASGGCCPMMAQMASCPKMIAAQMASTDDSATPCTTCCPKPCCAGENAEGVCDNPCPIPCPKPCCAEEGCCGSTGCPKTAAEDTTQ
jgi:hypothetical protein